MIKNELKLASIKFIILALEICLTFVCIINLIEITQKMATEPVDGFSFAFEQLEVQVNFYPFTGNIFFWGHT